jgi:tetratricopeptide (TPR) repeat protein
VLDEAIDSGRERAPISIKVWRAMLHYFRSEYSAGWARIEQVRPFVPSDCEFFVVMVYRFWRGLLLGNLGRISEALGIWKQSVEMARRNGDAFWSTRFPNCIGWLYREIRAFDLAIEHDREGVQVAHRDHVLEAEANSLINTGLDHVERADGESPEPIFAQVEAIFARDNWFRWRYNIRFQASQAEYWLRAGDLIRAREFADRLHELSSRYQARKYIAVAHTLRARIGMASREFEPALAELGAALDVLRAYPAPLQAWKTYAMLGRLHLQMGNAEAARMAFGESVATVRSIANNVEDELLRSNFLNSDAVREVFHGAEGSERTGAPS